MCTSVEEKNQLQRLRWQQQQAYTTIAETAMNDVGIGVVIFLVRGVAFLHTKIRGVAMGQHMPAV